MTFLPIVERELRVAARRRFTYWSRISAAGFALLIFGAIYGLEMMSGGAFKTGTVGFSILKWMVFVAACCAGIFLTSDSISEEKREGTLGLLFLTDLRGYDVVLGKLLSQSLRAAYGLLAVFPILALSLLIGGVTGKEFALSMLVLCNTLFFSLAIGLFVSVVSRDSTKAMTGALLISLVPLVLFPFLDSVIMEMKQATTFEPILSIASPSWLFAATSAYPPANFWTSLGTQHFAAWSLLVLASVLAPRAWKEKTANTQVSRSSFAHRFRFGGVRTRTRLRRRWLEKNPVLWLTLRDRWLPRFIWAAAFLVLAVQGASLFNYFRKFYSGTAGVGFDVFSGMGTILQYVFRIGLVLWVAVQASRVFIDSVRNGALELLLVTPVTPREIVRDQWSALCRTFFLPALCIILLQVGTGIYSAMQMSASMATMTGTMTVAGTNLPAPTNVVLALGGTNATNISISTNAGSITVGGTTTTVVTTGAAFGSGLVAYQIAGVISGIVTFLTGLAAVAWFGMWMGVTNRKNTVAVLKTVCFVIVLPWIVLMFVQGFAMAFLFMSMTGLSQPYTGMVLAQIVAVVLAVLKDAFFIGWSRVCLLEKFRATVAGDRSTRLRPSPALLPAALPAVQPPIPAPPGPFERVE